MFCNNCGFHLPEDVGRFCPNCGEIISFIPSSAPETPAKVQRPAAGEYDLDSGDLPDRSDQPAYRDPPAVPRSGRTAGRKKLIPILAAAAAVILLIVLAACLITGKSSGGFITYEKYPICCVSDGQFNVYYDGRVIYSKDGVRASFSYCNLDASARAAELTFDDGSSLLLRISGSKVTEIAEAEYFAYFGISAQSDAVWYVPADDEFDAAEYVGDLYFFSGKSPERIARDVYSCGVSVSPDGETLAYCDADHKGYIRKNGKTEKIGDELVPIAVSDNAECIYFYDVEDDCCYAQKGIGGEKVCLVEGDSSEFFFNADFTEVMFTDEGSGKTYLVTDCGEKQKIASVRYCRVLTPYNSGSGFNYGIFEFYSCPCRSFLGSYVYGTDEGGRRKLYYIDSSGSASCVAKNVNSILLADDGKTVFWLTDGGDLYYENAGAKNASEEKIAGDVSDFVITADGSRVWYLTDDSALYYLRVGSDDPKPVTDECRVLGGIFKGKQPVYEADGGLFLVDGTKTSELGDFDAEIFSCSAYRYYIFVTESEELSSGHMRYSYFSTDGVTFTLYDTYKSDY